MSLPLDPFDMRSELVCERDEVFQFGLDFYSMKSTTTTKSATKKSEKKKKKLSMTGK